MAPASVMIDKRTNKPWTTNTVCQKISEDTRRIDQDLAIIRDWLKKQPHLPDDWDEVCLRSFLKGCDYSLERCKVKLDMYFTMRTACPEFFTNRDVNRPELMEIMCKGLGPTMPDLTADGRRITISKAVDKSLSANHLKDLYKIIMMIGDIRLREPVPGVTGEIYIIDAAIVKPSHLAQLSPTLMKKFLICVQEAYPVKLKEVHVINTSAIAEAAYNIVKPFMKEKIKNRIHFHKNFKGLHNFIPKELLPEDFGGTNVTLKEAHDAWLEKLKSYRSWFKEQESIKANEALRPGKPTNYDELFGIDGSFRQLAID